MPYVNTVDNLADFFTKPLRAKTFFAMRDRIMNVSHDEARAMRAARRIRPRGGVERCSPEVPPSNV